MQNLQFQIRNSIEELRQSPYHQQLGRNLCAAFIAQQHGTRMDTASKKIEEPVGDLWLLVAEIIRQQCFEGARRKRRFISAPSRLRGFGYHSSRCPENAHTER